MKELPLQVAVEFAEAQRAPKKHEPDLSLAPFEPKSSRDWAPFVIERQEKDGRSPDDCWPWRGGARVELVKNRKNKKCVAVEFKRLVWMVSRPDQKLPRFVYTTCGDTWCSNPRHMTDKPSERPKRKVVIVSAKQSQRTVPSLKGTPIPIVKIGDWHQDQKHTAESALISIVQTLGVLSPEDRARVLASLNSYFP
jgi:hypothetical protein